MTTIHVIFSGGLDSTVALAQAVTERPRGTVRALGFEYGQKHVRELAAARQIAERLSVPYRIIQVPDVFTDSSLLARDARPVALGAYEASGMSETVVQGRNLLFASLAVAQASEGDRIVLGVHGGDHHLYGDCRPSFWRPASSAIFEAYGVAVETPFLNVGKHVIAARGATLGAPLELSWSCYAGGDRHCGRCGTCLERREAFARAEIPDPTDYEG